MAKKPNPMGEILGLSDTIEGIAAVVRAYYGEERELLPQPCKTRWALKSPAGHDFRLVAGVRPHCPHQAETPLRNGRLGGFSAACRGSMPAGNRGGRNGQPA